MLLACGIFVAVWPIVFGAIYAVLCRVEKLLFVRKYFLIISGVIITVVSFPMFILGLQISTIHQTGYIEVRQNIIAWYMLMCPIILLGALPIYFGVRGVIQERKERRENVRKDDL